MVKILYEQSFRDLERQFRVYLSSIREMIQKPDCIEEFEITCDEVKPIYVLCTIRYRINKKIKSNKFKLWHDLTESDVIKEIQNILYNAAVIE